MIDRRSRERQAERLARCYPKPWRTRYGDEFCELLVDELRDGSLSVLRGLGVVAHGLWTRLTYAGIAGGVVASDRRMRATLCALAAVSAAFLVLAVGTWAQLTIGWQWSAPADASTRTAIWLMSVGVFGLIALAVVVLPLFVLLLSAWQPRGFSRQWRPLVVSLGAGVILFLGCRHFGAHWARSLRSRVDATTTFFASQRHRSILFLGQHLTGRSLAPEDAEATSG